MANNPSPKIVLPSSDKTAALTQLLEQALQAKVVFESADQHHFTVTVISEQFIGLNRIKRQQLIYQAGLNTAISSGQIHAVELQTYTPEEWQQHESKHG